MSHHKSRTLGGRDLAPETLMMGFGYDPTLSEGAIKAPLFQTSTFVFKSAEDGKRFFEVAYGLREKEPDEALGLIYSRINNPNLEILEDRLAVWDAADKACKGAGPDCCAVADANGNPKKTNGVQHCACGGAIATAGPITNLRQRLQLTTARGVKQSLAPARTASDRKAAIR